MTRITKKQKENEGETGTSEQSDKNGQTRRNGKQNWIKMHQLKCRNQDMRTLDRATVNQGCCTTTGFVIEGLKDTMDTQVILGVTDTHSTDPDMSNF